MVTTRAVVVDAEDALSNSETAVSDWSVISSQNSHTDLLYSSNSSTNALRFRGQGSAGYRHC